MPMRHRRSLAAAVTADQVYGGTGSGDLLYGDSTDTCYPDNGPATTPCQ